MDGDGIKVTPLKPVQPPVTVYDNGKGAKVTVNDDGDDDDQEQDSNWLSRRLRISGFALVWAIYGVLFLKWDGATPGKKILKLKVVSLDGAELSKRQRWLRPVFSLVSAYAAFLGYLWALWDPQKRGWHDHLAGTRVVPAD
jgi:fatty acid desaturase